MAQGKVQSPLRRRSTSLGSGKGSLDDNWEVGGKYQIKSDSLQMWAGPENNEVVGELFRDDIVLLLRWVQVVGRPQLGFVLPAGGVPGWVPLQDWYSPGDGPVHKVKMPGSWTMGARYAVISEATVREDRMISSEWVAELVPGDEVLALELTINEGDDEDNKIRLRMKISTDSGTVGWISPQTARGEMLLHHVNLLGSEVVDIVRKSVAVTRSNSLMKLSSWKSTTSNTSEESSPQPGAKQRSYTPGQTMPWDVNGQYRVLETTKLKETHLLTSRDICRVPAGTLATIHRLELEPTDYCPVALVTIQGDGYLNGCKGWIRCTSTEGHDIIDFRDQHQFIKVQARLAEGERARQLREAREAEEAEEAPLSGVAGSTRAKRPSTAAGMPCMTGCLVAMLPALENLTNKARDAKTKRDRATASPSSSS